MANPVSLGEISHGHRFTSPASPLLGEHQKRKGLSLTAWLGPPTLCAGQSCLYYPCRVSSTSLFVLINVSGVCWLVLPVLGADSIQNDNSQEFQLANSGKMGPGKNFGPDIGATDGSLSWRPEPLFSRSRAPRQNRFQFAGLFKMEGS